MSATPTIFWPASFGLADFEPIQLYSGAQVWPAVSAKKPELILLDLMLPDLDGFAVCDQLKRNRETNLIPIVMVTAFKMPTIAPRACGSAPTATWQSHSRPSSSMRPSTRPSAWHEEHLKRGTNGEINFDIRSELTYLQQANDMLADLFAHTPLTDRQIKDLKQVRDGDGGQCHRVGPPKERGPGACGSPIASTPSRSP